MLYYTVLIRWERMTAAEEGRKGVGGEPRMGREGEKKGGEKGREGGGLMYEKAKDRNTNHVDVNRGQTRCVTLSSLVMPCPVLYFDHFC